MPPILESRRADSARRLGELKAELDDAARLVHGCSCVYLTGSFGRGEASPHSDLDLFIASRGAKDSPALSRLNEIRLKAKLIEAAQEHKFPEFSKDGQFLTNYTVDELIGTLGKPEDDSNNTFTARLLLLLESRSLIGEEVYKEAVGQVIESYWRDYERHKDDFVPSFLVNDILRLWRTFCVNYEARTKSADEIQRAKRRSKNFRLKHSRLLTCYSGIVYLLGVSVLKKTVSQEDAVAMTGMTPTERLEWVAREKRFAAGHKSVQQILDLYSKFLEQTGEAEEKLLTRFRDTNQAQILFQQADDLGNRIYELLFAIGSDGKSTLYRHLVV